MPSENAFFTVQRVDGIYGLGELQSALYGMHGISSVNVNSQTNEVAVNYNSSGSSYDLIENRLNKMGYQIIDDQSEINTR